MRFDKSSIAKFEDANGFLKVTGYAARIGVLAYPERNELVRADSLFDAQSMESLRGVPVTLGHPDKMVTPENFKELAVGSVLSVSKTDSGLLKVELSINDSDAIKDIQNGKIELSCGYDVDLLPENGQYNGIHYDAVQTNRVYNHIALVSRGRAGNSCKINLDSGDNSMAKIKMPNGVEVEIDDVSTATAINTEFQRLDGLCQDVSKEKARADALADELKTLKLRLDEDNISPVINLISQCKRFDSKFNHLNNGVLKTSKQMRIDALSSVNIDVTDKDDAYIKARFDIALEQLQDKEIEQQKLSTRADNQSFESELSPREKFIAEQEARR